MKELSIEEKSLLLKDLCARLPYGVYVEHITTEIRGKLKGIVFEHIYNNTDSIQDINAWVKFFGNEYVDATYFRPILRPMSSMTEEEIKEYKHLVAFSGNPEGSANLVDWLDKKMFAYRTIDGKDIFELGIALRASKGMYKF